MYWNFRFLALLSLAIFSASLSAYEQAEVTDGGQIVGRITATGPVPPNPTIPVTKDTDLCGTEIEADYTLVSADGGLKNAVVAIADISEGKPYDKTALVAFNNKSCMFDPHVAVGVAGQKLGINNSDPILHNTHLYHGPKQRTLYNIALPLQDRVIKKPLRRPGVVTVKCDAHEWMLGYVYVSDNPYVTISGDDGTFALEDVPPGTYTVNIWHEKLGEASVEVTVEAGSQAQLEHAYSN